ncbi:tetratricopeptide repeat protein [bacterium]|nr:tetratricopeptide repeat protein [bacterium]
MSSSAAERLESVRQELTRFRYAQALQAVEVLLADLEQAGGDEQLTGKAYELASEAAMGLGEFGQAQEYLTVALALVDDQQEPQRGAACQLSLAECYLRHGELRRSRHLVETILDQARDAGWQALEARALLQLGNVGWLEGDLPGAIKDLQQAIILFDDLELALPAFRARSSLGIAYNMCGRTDEAQEMFLLVLGFFQEKGDFTQVIRCLNNLAGIAFSRRDWDRAREYLLDCVKLETEIRNRSDLALSWFNLGLVELRLKDFTLARKYLNRAFQLSQEVDDRVTEASALMQLGIVSLLEGNPGEAVNYAGLARGRLEASPSTRTALLHWLTAVFQLANSQVEQAEELWRQRPPLVDQDALEGLVDMVKLIASAGYQNSVDMTAPARRKAGQWVNQLEH